MTRRDARRMARAWSDMGGLPYLLLDLVSSQKIQNAFSDGEYTDYLDVFRRFLKYDVLSQIDQYFILGEIGDAVKIAFHYPSQLLKAMEVLGRKLSLFGKKVRTPKLVPNFPKYTASCSILPVPKDRMTGKRIEPSEVIGTTLNGAIDINTHKLTEMFRLDSGLSFRNEIFSTYNLAVFVFEPLFESLQMEGNKLYIREVETNKDGAVVAKDNYIVMLCGENGCEVADEPEAYVKD